MGPLLLGLAFESDAEIGETLAVFVQALDILWEIRLYAECFCFSGFYDIKGQDFDLVVMTAISIFE
jgi:hypothetical protein